MTKREQILELLSRQAVVRPRDLARLGISGSYLNKLASEGVITRVSRGLYTTQDLSEHEHSSLIEATAQVPRGVICLLSALRFHGMTTQAPFEVWLAISVTARTPRTTYPPLRIARFSGTALSYGIAEHSLNRATVRVYSPAKTVADCFKYRNKIGLDVALEALRDGWQQRKFTMDSLWEAAEACRMANVMRPYLESLV